MGLETGSYINDLNPANPTAFDPKSQGDDHLRLEKLTLLNSLGGFPGAIQRMGTDGGAANAYTVAMSPTLAAYGNRMTLVFSPTVANTGACTLKIDSLAARPLRSVSGDPLLAGDMVPGVIYAAFYNGTEFRLLSVTKNYADQLAFNSALPAQLSNAGKALFTNGTSASWQFVFPTQAGNATKVLGTNGTDTAWRSVLPTVTKFTTSGTWVATSDTARLTLTGGGASSATSVNIAAGGAGGGTGIVTLRNLTIGASYTVTIGAGGIAPTTANTPGNAGGTTSFSGPGITTITATGGPAADANGATTGGTVTNCDLVFPGGTSQNLLPNVGAFARGGSSYFAPGAAPGQNGVAPGEGGGSVYGTATGKAGAAGIVIIEV